MSTDTSVHPLIAEIVEQRERLEATRARLEAEVRAETRRLAELIARTRDSDDPAVHPTAAARAIGVTKGYAHELVKKLDAGSL